MNPSMYQTEAARTLIDGKGRNLTGKDLMLNWCALGLTGEAGEIAELVKKGILHQHGLNVAALVEEIGDCCWYLAGLCTLLGHDFGEIMQFNVDKLKIRYPNGFNSEDSKKRVDK